MWDVRMLCVPVRLLTLLRHPNVVSLYGIVVDPVSRLPRWMVMERADGTLSDFLNRRKAAIGGITLYELFTIGIDVLEGLSHLHGIKPRPVVHR